MQIIVPKIEVIEQEPGIKGICKQVELAGRTCYQSFDKITETSAKDFTDRMMKSGHHAMLEHASIYLSIPSNDISSDIIQMFLELDKVWTKIEFKDEMYFISTNLRIIVNYFNLDEIIPYLCEPTDYHHKRITIRFTTAIDITREYNRHRVNSMAEMSTRYCNFSKDKFGSGIKVSSNVDISQEKAEQYLEDWGYDPFYRMCKSISLNEGDDFDIIDTWLFANLACEWSYLKLLDLGWKPQQARRVLPLDTHSELAHTAFESDWYHFLSLRSSDYGATGVHPDAAYLANKVYEAIR